MSRHATAEDLSAYLDEELEPVRLRLVETHLEECEECRRRVSGLSGVVGELRRLEHLRPPPALEQYLERRVALEPRPRGWVEGVEDRLRGLVLQPNLGLTFAMVFAFAVILYLFAGWSERQHRSSVQILRPTVPKTSLVSPVSLTNGEFVRVEGVWWEVGLSGESDLLPGLEIPVVEAVGEQGKRIRESQPGIDRLLAESAVILRFEGQVIRLDSE
ncbi:MAG: zf-HC2 domain-containing protein [Deltaproteobacteria bacterium]|nr:zf-HC2 domain-containing protein [Deltaproteobacteria bacterium]